MDNEDVVYIYTMEYYLAIKENELLTLATIWMDLEIRYKVKSVIKRKTNII